MMMRLGFASLAIAIAAAVACQPAERPGQEQSADSMEMQMMSDSSMMTDTVDMMAGDTAHHM